MVAEEMEQSHIPGAVLVVVRDGRVYLARGYGYADLEQRRPADPERTIFRIGSISKAFTATAVVQLADRGRIGLSDDVNRHLTDWTLPTPYGRPITFAHLLTHTAGLDEINQGRKAPSAGEVLPLGTFLRDRLVPRFAPGDRSSYSTYGIALAGHLVETVSGIPLGSYMEREIFGPLGMTRSSLGAVPERFQGDVATGYQYALDRYAPAAWEHFHTYPASDVNGTAADMARFMIAHLEGGHYGEARVLSDSAVGLMHRTHFRNDPRLLGFAYGFFEQQLRGHRALQHSGSMDGYWAGMWLWPEHRMGLFLAYNREVGSLEQRVVRRLAARTLPALDALDTEGTPWTRPRVRGDLTRFAGRYRSDVWCHSCTGERGYVPRAFDVEVADDSTISFWGGEWAQVEPLHFRVMNGQLEYGELYVAFRADATGRITHLINGPHVHGRESGLAVTAGPGAEEGVAVHPGVLDQYVGRYRLPDGLIVTVSRERAVLYGEASGVGRLPLIARSADTFEARALDAELTFVMDSGGRATHFLLRQAGSPEARASRVE